MTNSTVDNKSGTKNKVVTLGQLTFFNRDPVEELFHFLDSDEQYIFFHYFTDLIYKDSSLSNFRFGSVTPDSISKSVKKPPLPSTNSSEEVYLQLIHNNLSRFNQHFLTKKLLNNPNTSGKLCYCHYDTIDRINWLGDDLANHYLFLCNMPLSLSEIKSKMDIPMRVINGKKIKTLFTVHHPVVKPR
ncbi:MAG: hypothetical protein K0U41_06805 [Gammaproteobacteria bacterium]|nr:hypothetical protein [Gammaproteobacteria bacterium]